MLVLSIVFLSACGNTRVVEKQSSSNHQMRMANQEETKSGGVLPSFMNNKSEGMKTIYLAVAKNKKRLEMLPCYCGCGEEAGHLNNYDCFIKENKKNGKVVWDDHATGCGVCLEIAAQSILDFQNGKSIKEIQLEVDKKYQNGYAKPTSTPAV